MQRFDSLYEQSQRQMKERDDELIQKYLSFKKNVEFINLLLRNKKTLLIRYMKMCMIYICFTQLKQIWINLKRSG